jgi:hypothetical protein
MSGASTFQDARALQGELVEQRGIRRARVDVDPSGAVLVEVLAVPELPEAVVRRRVLDLARSRLGAGANVSVSVVFAARHGLRRGEHPRRKLSSLITRRTHERFSTQVILSRGGDVATGESECHPLHHPERSVAQAVVDGLYDVADRPVELHDVATVEVGEATLAVVSLSFGDRYLLGSAEVRFDVAEAIARATLHALNRSLSCAGR